MELLRKCRSQETSYAQNVEELVQKMENLESANIAVGREQECRICRWELALMCRCKWHVIDVGEEEEHHLAIAQCAVGPELYRTKKLFKFT